MNNRFFCLTLDITNYCNFNCKYCSLGIPYRQNYGHIDMSINDIKIIVMYINKYLQNHIIECRIRGGEPTLNKNLSEIIKEIQNIKKLRNLILLTNGSIPLNTYQIDYSLFNELRISVHTDTLEHKLNYFTIILNNIIFLLQNSIVPYIHIMKSIYTKNNILMSFFEQIVNLFNKYNVSTNSIEIKDTFSTENYINPKYVYTKIESLYNQHYELPVFYRSAIKIKPDMSYQYSCQIAKEYELPTNNAFLSNTWRYIKNHVNDKIICKSENCVCPIFCFKDE